MYIFAHVQAAGDTGDSDDGSDDRELRLTSDVFTMVVKQGDITMETTDAIVNSTNAELDLTQGIL